jgi:hypothetical protein
MPFSCAMAPRRAGKLFKNPRSRHRSAHYGVGAPRDRRATSYDEYLVAALSYFDIVVRYALLEDEEH